MSANRVQVPIDTTCSITRIPGNQISNHEPVGVISSVSSLPETVNTVNNIISTKISIVARDALAFDDHVRVVFS